MRHFIGLSLLFVSLTVMASCSSKQQPASDEPAERALGCQIEEPSTCVAEGMRWENAVGRSRDRNEAARHYAAACENGEADGCTHLGALFFEAEKFDRAAAMYEEACDGGSAEGCANLGFVKSRAGAIEEAIDLYTSACSDGATGACANLADAYQAGRGVELDHDRAKELFRRACYGGNASGCIRWSWAKAQGCAGEECENRAADEKEAVRLSGALCQESSDPVVCTGFGVHLESGRHVDRDRSRARELYLAACDDGEPWACERLGITLARGIGGAPDPTAGADALRRACDAGVASACSSLAAMALGGRGAERDEEQGARLLRKACDLHETRACNTILLLDLE